MTARLRELAERWNAEYAESEDAPMYSRLIAKRHADELLSILDAEGDGGAVVTELVRTAPEQIYLQISDNKADHEEAFPLGYSNEMTWCDESVLDCEVKYVRADLAANPQPTRSGGVSAADVVEACKAYDDSTASVYRSTSNTTQMRAALTHFAKGAEFGGGESCDVCHEPKGDGCACQDEYRSEHDSGDMER